jgi:hypothetical protein
MVPNPEYYCSEEQCPGEEPCPSPSMIPQSVEVGDSRIYAAILINERHAWSKDPIAPIVPERGFPKDACAEVAAVYVSMGRDAEHASWLTLREILEFEWDGRTIVREAIVSKEDALKFGPNQTGLPEGVRSYSEASRDGSRVTWTETYREAFGLEHLSNIIQELSRYGAPEDVRLILWCDR